MAFPTKLASKMSGATTHQLAYWRSSKVLIPEVESTKSPFLYSFRDVIALRTFAWLRGDHSLQMIRRGFDTMSELDMIEHPSSYKLVKLGKSIGVVRDDGTIIDIAKVPGQEVLGTLEDVFEEFDDHKGRHVDNLIHPRAGVEVNPDRLGGWPTITGTRIPFDTIADLIGDGSVAPERVASYYPGVSADAARDALSYQLDVAASA
jgi:uncharacterized protein (DUF433 family)